MSVAQALSSDGHVCIYENNSLLPPGVKKCCTVDPVIKKEFESQFLEAEVDWIPAMFIPLTANREKYQCRPLNNKPQPSGRALWYGVLSTDEPDGILWTQRCSSDANSRKLAQALKCPGDNGRVPRERMPEMHWF
ncbi:hypothetical protein DCS_03163 [Drechmeria coniospora]|uniref:Uncharacterized protein n=1 Tax=Drechmeria coniospora TaxID=98403 RepID=A0A151GY32_DRECN|nr:hypothetical protein DCS_03163 [Drechmeria coniospora]KYK62018.1 hypothetical protein DCS_03163 [Drechmeria coniospora]